ncbi:hypothetical protein N9Y89_02080 [bacterium]|nr:hypothetical protein [bacterium]
MIGKKGKNQLSMRQAPLEKVYPYACEDASLSKRIKRLELTISILILVVASYLGANSAEAINIIIFDDMIQGLKMFGKYLSLLGNVFESLPHIQMHYRL